MNRAAPEESRGGPINHSDTDYGDLVPNGGAGGQGDAWGGGSGGHGDSNRFGAAPKSVLVVQILCGVASALIRRCPRQDSNLL